MCCAAAEWTRPASCRFYRHQPSPESSFSVVVKKSGGTISCSVVHVWRAKSGTCLEPIIKTFSRVCVWKQLFPKCGGQQTAGYCTESSGTNHHGTRRALMHIICSLQVTVHSVGLKNTFSPQWLCHTLWSELTAGSLSHRPENQRQQHPTQTLLNKP